MSKIIKPIIKKEELLFESDELLKIFKKVFGDSVVDKAFYSKYYYGSEDLENQIKEGNNFLNNVNKLYDQSWNNFSLDLETYVIVFKNGNEVTFTNSEWGSITGVENAKP